MKGRKKQLSRQPEVRASAQVTSGENVWNSRLEHLFGVCVLRDYSWIFLLVLPEAIEDQIEGRQTESAHP